MKCGYLLNKPNLVWLGLILIVPLLAVGIFQINAVKTRQQTFDNLATIAELKANQIKAWHEERETDLRFLAAGTAFVSKVELLAQRDDAEAREIVSKRLAVYAQSKYYHSAFALRSSGEILATAGENDDSLPPESQLALQSAMQSGKAAHTELFRDSSGHIHIDYVLPIGQRHVAALLLRAQANEFLFPLIQTWPASSASAETLLVRRDGNDVLFLNELRHRHSTALILRESLNNINCPEAAAGRTSKALTMEGLDYRGVSSLAAIHPVNGTSWRVVAKIDREEVMAPLYSLAAWLSFLTLVAVATISYTLWKLWRQKLFSQQLIMDAKAAAIQQEGSERFRRMFDMSPDPVWIIEGHRFVNCNQAAINMLGYADKDALISTHPSELSPEYQPDGESSFSKAERMMAIADAQGIHRFEWVHKRADGSLFDAEVTLSAMRLSATDVIYCVWRDITERKKTEAALLESEEVLRQALNTAKQGWFIIDPRNGKILASPEYAEIFGYDTNEFVTDIPNFFAHVHPNDIELVTTTYRDCVENGGPVLLEYRRQTKSGDWKWMETSGRVVGWDADHRASRMVGISRDITERKQLEFELQRYQSHLEELVQNRTTALEEANRLLTMNDQRLSTMFSLSQKIHELNEQELIQVGIDEAVHLTDSAIGYIHFINDDQETITLKTWSTGTLPHCTAAYDEHYPISVAGIWADTARLRSPVIHNDYQTLANRKGYPEGHIPLTRHLGVPVIDGGKVRMLLGVGNKATDYEEPDAEQLQRIGLDLLGLVMRHRTESELAKAKEAAEVANKAKTAFLANMSHEIRTPMNAIIGLTYLLRRQTTTPEHVKWLGQISNAGKHLLTIINNILDLSKIEAGRLELEEIDFNVCALFDNVCSLMAQRAEAKGLLLAAEPDMPAYWLRGDPTRIRQALLNYAGNAIKFTGRGSVTLRKRILEETDDDVLVRFEVTDTGIGIPADKLGGLFQAFEQADVSTTRNYGGTGLGLAITRHLAELMGGEAGADSEPGKGSTFWFTARLRYGRDNMQPPVPKNSEDAEAALRRYAGSRILVADDVDINREVTQNLLNGSGMIIDMAKDGQKALEMARAHPYALILMDLQMPVMDGVDACRAIHALPGQETVPIIALTANAFDDSRQICLEAGMVDFISKPVEPTALYTTLLKWLPATAATALDNAPLQSSSPQPLSAPSACDISIPATENLPGLDIGRGLGLWRDAEVYRKFLRKFVSNFAGSVYTMTRALAENNGKEAAALAHKLKGAAANLALTDVTRLAAEIERSPDAKEAIDELLPQLQQALDTAQASIAQYAPAEETTVGPVIRLDPAQAAQLAPNLRALLQALDSDNPDRVEPLLNELASNLPTGYLQPVYTALEGFDFRGAEAATHDLAKALGVALEA